MAPEDSVRFEQALSRLEEIVKRLESGDLSLDESLLLYEEGVRLSRRCSELLDDAEKRIEVVTRDRDGSAVLSETSPVEHK